MDTAGNSFAAAITVDNGQTLRINADTSIASNITNDLATVTYTSGTPTVTETSTGALQDGSLATAGTWKFYNLTSGTGATLNINGAGTYVVDHNLSNTTTGVIGNTSGTPLVQMTGNGGAIGGGTGSITLYDLETTGTAQVTSLSNYTVSHVLTIDSSTQLDGSSATITLSGTTGTPFVVNGTFVPYLSTVAYTGNFASGNTNIADSATYYNLTLNNSSETYVPDALGTLTSTGTVTVTAGTLDDSGNTALTFNNLSISGTFSAPGAATFNLGGNLTNNGTFTHNSGTVTLNGTQQNQIMAGSGNPAITFSALTLSGANTVLFTAGETFRTNGLLTISNGTNVDSTTMSQWFINHQGTETVNAGTITNSGCNVSSTTITVTTGVNGGNNGTCWAFPTVPQAITIKGNTDIQGTTTIK